MENRNEKLAKLISLNKMKQSRLLVIRDFLAKTGMILSDENFLFLEETADARTMVYQMVRRIGKPLQLKNLSEVITKLKNIIELNQLLKDEQLILFHDRDAESGALMITFTEFSCYYKEIIDFLGDQDIIAIQLKGNFGICFEAEEYSYLETVWGF